jgi:uncharacterized protein
MGGVHVEKLISDLLRLVTDAEVLQEILHYVAINRREAIHLHSTLYSGLPTKYCLSMPPRPEIVMGHRQMSARDALHLAIMEHYGIERILSFDAGFDGFPGIERFS